MKVDILIIDPAEMVFRRSNPPGEDYPILDLIDGRHHTSLLFKDWHQLRELKEKIDTFLMEEGFRRMTVNETETTNA